MENKQLTNQQVEVTEVKEEKKGFMEKAKGFMKSKPVKIATGVLAGIGLFGLGMAIGKKGSNSYDEEGCYYEEDEVDSVDIYDDTEE